jgi:hypothetical protein
MVIVTVETLLEILKDYMTEEYIPADAKIVSLMVNPNEKGKFALVAESPQWSREGAPIEVRFDVRRVYSVG